MSDKSCCWSITINNPTAEDFQQWESLKGQPWVRSVSGQIEKGEQEETPHLQGMVKTLSVRFSQVKKALPRAHIEKARNEAALAKYVAKEETRVSTLPKVKVATQIEVQQYCLTVTLSRCYHWLEIEDPSSIEDTELLSRCETQIRENWENILDDAVNSLILQGYYGVEFVVSNPQVRTAFKKYLPAIMYRTLNDRNKAI